MTSSQSCIQCGSAVENPQQTGVLCAGCSARADASEEVAAIQRVDRVATAALVIGCLPFVATFRKSSSSSVTINGQKVESRQNAIDYVAVSAGALAALLALVALARALRAPAKVRGYRLAMAIGGLLLGGFQIFLGMR
jgi:hypothetical protein